MCRMIFLTMALTESKLQALHGKKNKNTKIIPDRDGLYISCGLKGKLTWVFRYRFEGEQKRMTMGTYPEYSLDEAREKLISLRRRLYEGFDPKVPEVEFKQKVTLAYCTQKWLEIKVPTLKPKTQGQYKSTASIYLLDKNFTVDVQTAAREEWIRFFDNVAEKTSRVNAGQVLKLVKTVLRWSRSRSYITGSAVLDFEISAVGDKPKQGQRNLQMHEVGLLWAMINKSRATPAVKNCTKLLIIFGARNAEIREALRSEFDLERGIWTLPPERSKTGKELRRPIPEKAKGIIQELDETYGNNGYLIPGAHLGTCVTHPALRKYVIRLRLKMLDIDESFRAFTPHDFRRTISTRLSEQGVLPHVTEKMLGHELGGVMAVYNKHDWINDQLEAYELWCKMISEAAQEELSRIN